MIRIDDLKKTFGTKIILDHVSYHFPEGERIALVGANGAGKTTLLDILTGDEDFDGGKILKPERVRLGYLPQEPNPNPAESCLLEAVSGGEGYLQALYRRHHEALQKMSTDYSDKNHHAFELIDIEFQREGGYAMESDAKAVLKGLGFTDQMIAASPKSLSGGWRMRLELAKIFVNRPNFLILDEPTNHLDLPSLIWVERWLQAFQGTLLFVSHDKSLLDRLPTQTLHLHQGKLTPYKGNFSSFLEQRELRMQQDAATAESLKRRREHLQSFVDRFGAKASKAAQAQSRVKMIARIRDMEDAVPSDGQADSIALTIPMGEPSGREVLKVKGGAIGYDRTLASDIDLLLEKKQRVAIIGANGIGKSTFLKTIAGKLAPKAGTFEFGYNVSMAWFAQDQLDILDNSKNLMYNVLQASSQTSEREARSLLGSLLFRGDDVFKTVKVLSGGEKARVGLARLLAQRANFLVMDEPTNHLDLSSVEILAEALEDYPGTLLFVSHDRNFIDAICTHVFVMLPDGRSRLFEGKLEDYERLARASGFPNVLEPAPVENEKTTGKSTNPSSKTISRELDQHDVPQMKRDLQKVEKRILELDRKLESGAKTLKDLDDQMTSMQANFSKLAELDAMKSRLLLEQSQFEEEWLAQSDAREKLKDVLSRIGRT